jgi:hypothetical protein
MRAVDNEEALAWIKSQPNILVENKELSFPTPGAGEFHFHFPAGEGQLIYFSRLLTSLHHDESTFAGALLWITQCGVGNDWTEDVGYKAVSLLRGEDGDRASFLQRRAQFFEANELIHAAVFLLQPMLAGWDAWYCPVFKDAEPDYMVFISHDAYVNVIPATAETYEKIQKRLELTAFRETNH